MGPNFRGGIKLDATKSMIKFMYAKNIIVVSALFGIFGVGNRMTP